VTSFDTDTMRARPLTVPGVYEFTPRLFRDDRGSFQAPYQEPAFRAAVGRPLFPVAQTAHTISRAGVFRGIHFTATPPGNEKYVYCSGGRALLVVVDLRIGSPAFGRWDAVEATPESLRALSLPIGVGLGYLARADHTAITYLLSSGYVPEHELAVSAVDPALALPIPADTQLIQADRDRAAPTLAQARQAGLLPDYRTCLQLAGS